jgi:hypothetical protein
MTRRAKLVFMGGARKEVQHSSKKKSLHSASAFKMGKLKRFCGS